jgi:hypothetical protein
MAVLLGAVGVPHYTKDGKLFTGPTHKDASGRLMTGRTHTANSQFLFHNKSGIGGVSNKRFNFTTLNNKKELLFYLSSKGYSDFEVDVIEFDISKRMKYPIKISKVNNFLKSL